MKVAQRKSKIRDQTTKPTIFEQHTQVDKTLNIPSETTLNISFATTIKSKFRDAAKKLKTLKTNERLTIQNLPDKNSS